MSNNRVFYPVHYLALGEYQTGTASGIHGLQSISMTTSFNLDTVFELGQLDIYENIENLPDIEITAEKVLDGYPLLYHMSTRGATTPTLLNRTNNRADVYISIFDDEQDNASGTPLSQVFCSGMYLNSLSYNLPVQGNCTESVTLVGNDKIWKTTAAFNGHFSGNDAPAATSGVQRRENVVMGSGNSRWPTEIPGITTTGGAAGFNELTNDVYGAHIQDVSISVNFNREDLFELGRRKPYYRFASFPVQVDCSINVINAGTDPSDGINANSDAAANISDQRIVIELTDTTVFDLGTRNKLQSVTYSGGNTDGDVVISTYNYQNFNILEITADHDPEGL